MYADLKKLASILMIIFILAISIFVNVKVVFSENVGGKIDLFTQKEPFSGKGPDMPSDAFGLEELVILYALVTFDGVPIQDKLVTFQVQPPRDPPFTFTDLTNSSGIAEANFTTPLKSPDLTEVFGEWFVIATVHINGDVLQDTLTFKVDWVIKLLSVRTINENLIYKREFGKEGYVGLEIILRSIAMIGKNATIAAVIKDEVDFPVTSLLIRDFYVMPNEKLVYLYCKLFLPKWSRVGTATAIVSVLTAPANENGVAYCPSISTELFIKPSDPVFPSFHDIAVVEVIPSATSVEIGQVVTIRALVQNEGSEIESFNVSAYYDGALIETLRVTALAPYSKEIINFTFNTSLVNIGKYKITVSISHLINETDITDNEFIDGIINVKPKQPSVIHDVAIIDVKISSNTIYVGEHLYITVKVVNKGTEIETFNVNTYYGFSLIETLQVSTLEPDAQRTLVFVWDTSSVNEGYYQINAYADLPNDINVLDNTFLDGIVHVRAPPPLHDIAVTSMFPSSHTFHIGKVAEIYVTVKNLGDYSETFTVTAYYNSNVIGTITVENLPSKSEKTLVFSWNLQNVNEGEYVLSARAEPVQYEKNLENNVFIDGVVKVTYGLEGWSLLILLLLILLLLLLLLAILLAAAFYRRRKKKKSGKPFPNAWTAWYYGHELHKRRHTV
jgi:hypothetical protein